MTSATTPTRRRSILFWAIAAVASLHFALAFSLTLPRLWDLPTFAYANIAYPYRRRILIRGLYRLVLHFTQSPTVPLGHGAVTTVALLNIVLAFSSVMLAVLAARLLIAQILGRQSPFRWLSLLVVYCCSYHFLLIPENRVQFPYDLPSMAFFGLATYAAFTRNRWLYYPIFLLATFNRESTLFLPLIFLIFALREDLPLPRALRSLPLRLYAETAVQLLAWVFILHLCESLTGGPTTLPTHLRQNLHLLTNPIHWPTFLSLFGFLWIPYLLFFRRIRSPRLERCVLLAPLWAAAMFLYADILEIRVNSEAIVYITVCIALILSNTIQQRPPLTPRDALDPTP